VSFWGHDGGRDPNSTWTIHTHTHTPSFAGPDHEKGPFPEIRPSRSNTHIPLTTVKAMTGMPPTRFIIPASSACQLVAHNGQRWEQACPPCSERASSPYAASARSAMHTQRAASRCRRYEGATCLREHLKDSETLENGHTSASSLESDSVSPSPKDLSPGYFVARICL